MSTAKFRGSLTALVTPFRDGALDEKGFRDLIDWQIAEGRYSDAGGVLDLPTVEATNLHTVSTLVAEAALARRESRGCHRRSDIAPAVSNGAAA